MMQFKKKFNPSLKLVSILTIMLFSMMSMGCERQKQAPPPKPVPVVSTITVSTQPVVLETELPGRTSVYKIAQIRPQVNGLIQKRLFTEGSDIKAGQILYQIDPTPFQATVDNALANLTVMQRSADRAMAALNTSIAEVTRQQATLTLSKLNRKRFDELIKTNAVSESERDQVVTAAKVAEASLRAAEAQVEGSRGGVAVAKAAIHQAEAALKTTRINLGYCSVLAPISGRIGKSNITEGAIVTAYQPLPMATIQQLDPIYVDVPQATTELLRLKHRLQDENLNHGGNNQNKVRLILEDGAAYPLEGTLQFSDVTVDPTTGSVILRIVFPNPESILLPGMFVRAVIKEGVDEQAIMVPQQGVSRAHAGKPSSLIVNTAGKVVQRMLTLDRAIGDKWLVSTGLAPGDRLIVEGMQRVRPGATVKEVPFEGTQTNSESEAGHGVPSKMRKDGGA